MEPETAKELMKIQNAFEYKESKAILVVIQISQERQWIQMPLKDHSVALQDIVHQIEFGPP